MTGPLRFARTLAPKLVIGGLCAAATATLAVGGAPIPPCSPDGVCLPNYESWGWYPTRWRPFPGDSAAGTPAEAAKQGPTAAEETLGGPTLPSATQEGDVGPKKKPGANNGAPAPTLPTPPGAGPVGPATAEPTPEPAPGAGADGVPPGAEGILPPVENLPPAGGDAAPGTIPDPTAPIDPFGAAPPAPPSWMIEQASFEPLPTHGGVSPMTGATQNFAPSANDAPNMQGDDAPPALPADLQNLFGATVGRPTWMQPAAQAATLAQPTLVRPAQRTAVQQGVMQTSAEAPLGIQLINPASAVTTPTDAGGTQQAIYFEASDHDASSAVALPPVAPEN